MFYAKYVALAVLALLSMFGCARQAIPPPSQEKVCCAFIIQGDIMTDDLMTQEECLKQPHGEVIEVAPGLLTPHPCCPDATGPTCGDAAR